MEIGLFQLENLFLSPSRYLFFDLRDERQAMGPSLDKYLNKAMSMAADQVEAHLKEQKTPLEFPILLVCETGEISGDKARALESAGYNNIYVVTGGVTGLLSEL